MASRYTTMRRTLGLAGTTVNAMALIAPGAFLWITYQLQAAQVAPGSGQTTALDMWPGILFALAVAFLTAVSYSELARIFPDGGTGSCYYFAEKAFTDKLQARHRRWARSAKLLTGWAAHLFYWVYPGVMVAFMAVLVSYVAGQFGMAVGVPAQMALAIVFALGIGYIAIRGVTGSTLASLFVNVIQITALVGFSALAIAFRLTSPNPSEFVFPDVGTVLLPKDFAHVLSQATIALFLLVGFESATAFGAEAKNPRRDIPKAVMLSLAIQGLFCYVLEYFAANLALSTRLTAVDATGATVTGLQAAAASSAPIGDLLLLVGDSMVRGLGIALMLSTAFAVMLSMLGTTLSAMNTGIRITYAMAQDAEMPELLGLLHNRYATPHRAGMAMAVVSAIIGCIGVLSVVTLTGITLASNLGTLVLYALTCLWTLVAFADRPDYNVYKHLLFPGLGLLANLLILAMIFGRGLSGSGTPQAESLIALGIGGLWAVASMVYVFISNRRNGRGLFSLPTRSPLG